MDSMRKRILISTLGILTLVAILAGLLGVIDSIAKSGPVAPSPGPSNANLKSLTGLSLPKIDISRLKGLADLLAKVDPSVLKNLTNLLGKIDPNVLKSLTDLLSKIDPSVLNNLANLLSKIDPNVLKSLTELLSKIDPSSLKDLASLLGKIDPSSITDLANLASDIKIDPNVLKSLTELLSKIDPSSLKDLASLLGKIDPGGLQDLASLLGKIDPGSLQDLASLLGNAKFDPSVLNGLADLLGKMDPSSLQDLASLLGKIDPSSLQYLASLLGNAKFDPSSLESLANFFANSNIDPSVLHDLASLLGDTKIDFGRVTWIYSVILAAVLVGAGGGYFLYRRRERRVIPAVADGVQTVDSPQKALPESVVTQSSGIKLSIEFPGIEPVLPDVWGVHENLIILCRLADVNGLPISAKPLRITIDKPMTNVNTDASGTVRLEHLFTDKGQYTFMAEYNSGTDVESASRTVRIVDYREEIVDLYKGLKSWFHQIMGIALDQDATPRELEEIVTKSRKGVSAAALNRVVNCFEEADYSLHPMQREHYKIMYLAQQEIRKY